MSEKNVRSLSGSAPEAMSLNNVAAVPVDGHKLGDEEYQRIKLAEALSPPAASSERLAVRADFTNPVDLMRAFDSIISRDSAVAAKIVK